MIKDDYVKSKLIYIDNKLMDGDLCVMMDWEDSLMKKSAEVICKSKGKVLNIGFGLGIIDNYIQELGVDSHYIIECHPDVISKMRNDGWYEKNNVIILEGFWQDYIDKLSEFDGVYFDTWKEADIELFFEKSANILKTNGIMSFFNSSPLMFKNMHYVNEDFYKILSKNFNLSSELFKLDLTNKNIDSMEQYWDINRTTTPITVCYKK